MKIQHNLPALNAMLYNNAANSNGIKASEKLSSGYRINSAADDAAGLAISEKMRSQLRGLKQSVRNSQDAINLVQTFEGALDGSTSILQRCKELAVQSANGNYDNDDDRAAIQLEYDQLCGEIDHIADTDFNGVYMLNGNPSVEYVDTVKTILVEGIDLPLLLDKNGKPVFDENGNLVYDTKSYKFNARYSDAGHTESPFHNGTFAPAYYLSTSTNGTGTGTANNSETYVLTEYNSGSTDFFNITVRGTYQSAQKTYDFKLSPSSNAEYSSGTNADGNKVYTCKRKFTVSGAGETPKVVCELVQRAAQRPEYLQQNGTNALNQNGKPILTSLQWDLDYEIKLGDDTDPDFLLDDIDVRMFCDTILNDDHDERYFTSDPSVEGAIDHELLYDRNNMIDSFSSFFRNTNNTVISSVSNRIDVDTSAGGPDLLKLGLFSRTDDLTNLSYIPDGADLAYIMVWQNRTPDVNGVIKFSAGNRGLAYSASDVNINPDPILIPVEYVETDAVTVYNDVELCVQAGARTKDLVKFAFEYEIYEGSELKADLNCTAMGLGLDKLSLSEQESANSAIDRLENALNKVSLVRANFGATQNRLEKKINNLTNIHENVTASESDIRDADIPQEMMNFTKTQILAQASQAMFAQTKELPRSVLNLLS